MWSKIGIGFSSFLRRKKTPKDGFIATYGKSLLFREVFDQIVSIHTQDTFSLDPKKFSK